MFLFDMAEKPSRFFVPCENRNRAGKFCTLVARADVQRGSPVCYVAHVCQNISFVDVAARGFYSSLKSLANRVEQTRKITNIQRRDLPKEERWANEWLGGRVSMESSQPGQKRTLKCVRVGRQR